MLSLWFCFLFGGILSFFRPLLRGSYFCFKDCLEGPILSPCCFFTTKKAVEKRERDPISLSVSPFLRGRTGKDGELKRSCPPILPFFKGRMGLPLKGKPLKSRSKRYWNPFKKCLQKKHTVGDPFKKAFKKVQEPHLKKAFKKNRKPLKNLGKNGEMPFHYNCSVARIPLHEKGDR